MENSLPPIKKQKLHIYPFSDSWILINDSNKKTESFSSANEALENARRIFKECLNHEIVIHSKYDSLPHFRITG
jgi:hypothetical protein